VLTLPVTLCAVAAAALLLLTQLHMLHTVDGALQPLQVPATCQLATPWRQSLPQRCCYCLSGTLQPESHLVAAPAADRRMLLVCALAIILALQVSADLLLLTMQ
jgi:hypothetical protein